MRILFVQKEGGIFGAENYQLKVIPGLTQSGVQLEFLRLYTDFQGGRGGEFVNRLNDMGIKTHEVNIGKYPTPTVLRKIKKVVDNGGFDIVHTHLIHADFHLALIKTFMGLKSKLISTKHGYDNDFTSRFGFDASKQRNTPYFLISRWAEKRMNASYTISKGLLDFFLKTGLTKGDKMKLIPYGFDMPEHYLSKDNEAYRKSEKQILIAGRLVAFKGHEYLLEAMSLMVQYGDKSTKLLIAGTGPLEDQLKRKVVDLDLVDHVIFLGYSREVGAYMANSDIVVVPSISEGFGVVFLEGFAAKTPIVSWDVPAGNELMVHGESGYLVPPYDVTKLARQLADILDNPEAQNAIVDSAYSKLKGYYNLDRMKKDTINLYRSVVDS